MVCVYRVCEKDGCWFVMASAQLAGFEELREPAPASVSKHKDLKAVASPQPRAAHVGFVDRKRVSARAPACFSARVGLLSFVHVFLVNLGTLFDLSS